MQPVALVVEDEDDITTLLAFSLRKAGFAVTCVKNLSEARAQVKKALPDVVVLDWMLPDGEGIAWLNAVRADARTARLPVLMLTARAQEIDKLKGLELGADDYITKPFSPKELVARINTVLRRTAPQHVTQEIQFADCVLRDDDLSLVQGERVIQIGGTEYKLLKFFLTHSERSYTRAQLLDLVWGDHVYIEERTVDVHILRLRKILQKVGLEAHLETVRGVGYRWQNEVQK
ncbi:MAG: response regulator [Hydromonas sp.]|nr:response regulator [Hydromonas sp.]MBP6294688.1 response regulator [Hydromonas sp.]